MKFFRRGKEDGELNKGFGRPLCKRQQTLAQNFDPETSFQDVPPQPPGSLGAAFEKGGELFPTSAHSSFDQNLGQNQGDRIFGDGAKKESKQGNGRPVFGIDDGSSVEPEAETASKVTATGSVQSEENFSDNDTKGGEKRKDQSEVLVEERSDLVSGEQPQVSEGQQAAGASGGVQVTTEGKTVVVRGQGAEGLREMLKQLKINEKLCCLLEGDELFQTEKEKGVFLKMIQGILNMTIPELVQKIRKDPTGTIRLHHIRKLEAVIKTAQAEIGELDMLRNETSRVAREELEARNSARQSEREKLEKDCKELLDKKEEAEEAYRAEVARLEELMRQALAKRNEAISDADAEINKKSQRILVLEEQKKKDEKDFAEAINEVEEDTVAQQEKAKEVVGLVQQYLKAIGKLEAGEENAADAVSAGQSHPVKKMATGGSGRS